MKNYYLPKKTKGQRVKWLVSNEYFDFVGPNGYEVAQFHHVFSSWTAPSLMNLGSFG